MFDYAAPIVYPNFSATSISRLQKVQNRALRLALGCHIAASVDHLHTEAVVLPVEAHLKLLSAQFLAKALQPHHPSHATVLLDRGARHLKETLRSKVFDVVQPHLDGNGLVQPGLYKKTIDAIHMDVVSETIENLTPNRVLGTRPPLVSPSEKFLPRLTRSTLSQLRSGLCARLKDFQHRIGRADDENCPDCLVATQDTAHLFECPSFPSSLSPSDLWERPWNAAAFLQTTPSFSFLPCSGPPPPPPRRRPRRRPPPDPPDPP